MIIDCISDLHGFRPRLSGGDLLIVAGDLTARDTIQEHLDFAEWLANQKYRKKILIAGNHDNKMKDWIPMIQDDVEYLIDSGTEFEGFKIWGSPHSLWFHGINPHCKAFTGSEKDISKNFELIPHDIDILVTHSPPIGVMDKVKKYNDRGSWNPKTDGYQFVGSVSLSAQIGFLTNLKLHVFGHIHEGYGKIDPPAYLPNYFDVCKHYSVNASHVNEDYEPVNQPIRIEL